MAGNSEGARKTVKKILARDPDFYKKIGHIGGRKGHTGGFACTEIGEDGLTGAERAKVAGAKSGKISKRGFKFIREENGHRVYLAKNTGSVVKYEI